MEKPVGVAPATLVTRWVPAESQRASQWELYLLGFLLTSLSSQMVSSFLLYDEHAEKSIFLRVIFLTAAIERLTLLQSCVFLHSIFLKIYLFLEREEGREKERERKVNV